MKELFEKEIALLKTGIKVLDKHVIETGENVINSILSYLRAEYRTVSVDFFSPTGGQMQFKISSPSWEPPKRGEDKMIFFPRKEGAVFLEAAPPLPGSDKLDWKDKKVVMALSALDMAKIAAGIVFDRLESDIRIVHANEEKTDIKTFVLSAWSTFKDTKQSKISLRHQQMVKDEKGKPVLQERCSISMYITPANVYQLKLLADTSLPIVLGNIR